MTAATSSTAPSIPLPLERMADAARPPVRRHPDEHGAALLCGTSIIDGKLRPSRPRGHPCRSTASTTCRARAATVTSTAPSSPAPSAGPRTQAWSTSLSTTTVDTDEVGFSAADMASHERGYPTLLALNGAPVGGLVLAEHALAGDIWFTDGHRRPVETTVVVGPSMDVIDRRHARGDDGTSARRRQLARQALVFGDAGNDRMKRLKVGIVGAGGIGMLIIQALSRLGIGHFVIIDPDYVSITNLSRLPEATERDATGPSATGGSAGSPRSSGSTGPPGRSTSPSGSSAAPTRTPSVDTIRGDVADDQVARRLLGCDFIFLAADTMLARDVVNQIAYQYLIPDPPGRLQGRASTRPPGRSSTSTASSGPSARPRVHALQRPDEPRQARRGVGRHRRAATQPALRRRARHRGTERHHPQHRSRPDGQSTTSCTTPAASAGPTGGSGFCATGRSSRPPAAGRQEPHRRPDLPRLRERAALGARRTATARTSDSHS